MSSGLQLSGRDRRTLRVGVVAIACIVAVGRGGPALQRLERNHQAYAREVVAELATLRAAAVGSEAIQDSLLARRRRLETLGGRVFRAGSPQLAAAQLATLLGDFATTSGARVNATILRPDTAFVKGLTRVAVRLSVSTDVQGLAAILRRIERDVRILAVRELSVSGSDPSAPQTRAESLVADMVVETLAAEAEFRRAPTTRDRE